MSGLTVGTCFAIRIMRLKQYYKGGTVIESPTTRRIEYTGYSSDGYIRLTYAYFCKLLFRHRSSISDNALREELASQIIPAVRAGYCDWMDDSTMAQVSVSWAWFAIAEGVPELLAPGGVNSNVMLVSARGRDLGWSRTDQLLQRWLTRRQWHPIKCGEDIFAGYPRSTMQ